ncbi:hypothetical protein Tco_0978441 [Tanacetum coccineum]|uniref:Uncharacterized protein n=1 Tax=Tanacetum coccineum TaxID=301880 RepID=A0ABQ5EN52_9ASTR
MCTRSSTTNLFSPFEDPERLISRRNRGEPSLLFDFEEINTNPNFSPFYSHDLRTMEELLKPSLIDRGGPIAPTTVPGNLILGEIPYDREDYCACFKSKGRHHEHTKKTKGDSANKVGVTEREGKATVIPTKSEGRRTENRRKEKPWPQDKGGKSRPKSEKKAESQPRGNSSMQGSRLGTRSDQDQKEADDKRAKQRGREHWKYDGFLPSWLGDSLNVAPVKKKNADPKHHWGGVDDPVQVKRRILLNIFGWFDKPSCESERVLIPEPFPVSLSIDQKEDMERRISKEEVKRAMWDCGVE